MNASMIATFLRSRKLRPVNHKLPVDERALRARLNRHLKKERRALLVSASRTAAFDIFGRFALIDLDRGLVIQTKIDLEVLCRKLNVLKRHETLSKNPAP